MNPSASRVNESGRFARGSEDPNPSYRPTETRTLPSGVVIIDGAKFGEMLRDLEFWKSYKPKGWKA